MKRLGALVFAFGTSLAMAQSPPTPGMPQLLLTPELAQQQRAEVLCFGLLTFRDENVAPARAEIQRRGIDCMNYIGEVRALYRTRVQEDAALLLGQQPPAVVPPSAAYRPQIPPIDFNPVAPLPLSPGRPAVQCVSQMVLGQLQTTCR